MFDRRRRTVLVAFALVLGLVPTFVAPAAAISSSVVISEVYGGGGNVGATLTHDFIELYNLSGAPVDLTGWSVQYAASAGTTWAVTPLSGSIAPGSFYLIQQAQGAGGTTPLPPPNAVGSTFMSATSGKVALVNTTTMLTGSGCPFSPSIVDFVGYGAAATCSETLPTGNTSNTTSAARSNPATDTDNNSVDFTVGTPAPVAGDNAPAVSATSPINGATGVALDANVDITFTEPVNVTGAWFSISCTQSGAHSAVVTGGPTTYTLDPDVDFSDGEDCTVSVFGANVSDQDPNDPPDLGADFNFTFGTGTPVDPCTSPYDPAYAIQGTGSAAAITGAVTTQGVVVGDFEGPSPTLRGFYLQDPSGDGDMASSDGIFVFNGDANSVSLGDLVRVSGNASEFQDQTQISAASIIPCGTGSVSPVDVSMPFPDAAHLERFEGMLVRFPQTLSVTEHFQLGRFGQVVVSSGGRLVQPTSVVLPGAAANALQAANNLNRLIVDDALQNQNPDPIVFGRGGQPLSAANTLRGGDTATGMVGVMTYTWAGNSASPNNYRLRPINALGGSVAFLDANPRPAVNPSVGGEIAAATFNLLNYFNTFGAGSCSFGVGGAATDCRGADSSAEFDRQWPKTVAAVIGSNADVIGVNEIENDGYGPTSAIQHLVDRLNEVAGAGTYAFIDFDAATGQLNALGTDAIKVGVIYRATTVTPVGNTAVLNSVAFVNGGDSGPRNRPTYAQAFSDSSGGTFVVSGNHLKSKGSPCDLPDQGDGQGNCAAVRTAAANLLASFLASDPTGTGELDVLILGDLNSYAKEDPITTLLGAGYSNLVLDYLGEDAYSFAFDGQWGYLDHALGFSVLIDQVTGVGEWHINADEPNVLDYNTNFKSPGQIVSLYAPDQFRSSDHDPLTVGLDLVPTYEFGGFQSPFDPGATNLVNAGQALPVKFSLEGDQGLGIIEVSRWIITDCATGAVIGSEMAAGVLSYSAALDTYTYNAKSQKLWAGQCRSLELILDDGTVHPLDFRFR